MQEPPWPSEEDQTIIQAKYAEGVVVRTSGGLDDDWTNRRYNEADLWAYQTLELSGCARPSEDDPSRRRVYQQEA